MQEMQMIAESLERLHDSVRLLLKERVVKKYYSTSDVGQILGKSDFTVREWCRNARCVASKRQIGRGNSKEWMISHEELERIQSEGLLARN